MNIGAVLFGAYLAIGLVVAGVILTTAGSKAKARSAIEVLGDLATLHSVAFMIFAGLWPLWLVVSWKAKPSESANRSSETVHPESRSGSQSDSM